MSDNGKPCVSNKLTSLENRFKTQENYDTLLIF